MTERKKVTGEKPHEIIEKSKETTSPTAEVNPDVGSETGADLIEAAREQEEQSQREAEELLTSIQEEKPSKQLPAVRTLSELTPADIETVHSTIAQLGIEKTPITASLFTGNKTATEYDSKVTNFSTRTSIVELSDGRKLFVVNSRGSNIHRFFDGFMKKMTGCEMKKVPQKEWKGTFEKKSNIPTIENGDPNTVVLPFIPNINAYDLFRNRDEIQDFGECQFAKEVDEKKLLELVDKIVDKIQEVHDKGIAWGETNLPNIIIDKTEEVHICDPEMKFNERISLPEQKARDLLDLLHSTAGAMNQAEGTDYRIVVERIVSQYKDEEVLQQLQSLVGKKMKLLHKIFFGYTQVRLGQKNRKEFKDIRNTIGETLQQKFAT